ncbi:thiaminase II [Desulfurococcaceae archaeon AG1]|jgi:thiaminase/transcriptional activator TenA|nr:MAG: thiaminase II [Desulfurococcaceae archaeon]GAY25023.1 thiaminase II [Desulfurococcaceae archaeon AG1]
MKTPTQRLWDSIEDIFKAILEHPFIEGLTTGDLRLESFKYYVIQDSLYLRDFSRALSRLSSRSRRDEWISMFAEHAKTAIDVEKSLHRSFLAEWGIGEEEIMKKPQSPVNYAYTSHLLRMTSEESYEEAIAAVLPCYWIYLEVGKHLERKGSPNPLYRRWIETYSSSTYESVVRAVLKVADTILSRVESDAWTSVERAFRISSIYEYLFWDSAYRLEDWVFKVW